MPRMHSGQNYDVVTLTAAPARTPRARDILAAICGNGEMAPSPPPFRQHRSLISRPPQAKTTPWPSHVVQ